MPREVAALGCRRLEVGVLDLDAGVLRTTDGRTEVLSRLEAQLLQYLAARPGEVVATEQLHREVWGYSPRVRSRAADKMTYRLRRKLEADPQHPQHLLRVAGEGLSLVLPAPLPEAPSPPAPSRRLHGRDADVARASEAWSAPGLVTLCGPGGVGKTALAHALADAQRRAGERVSWVSAAAARSDDALVAAAGRAAGVPVGSARQEGALSSRWTRDGAWVVLDNLEQLGEVAGEVLARWTTANPRTHFLATSRAPLRCAGERVVRLEGLSPDAAEALFRDRAHAAGATLADPEPALASLLHQLEGLPLAVEMAAARAVVLPPSSLVEQLDRRLRWLVSRRADRPARHRSLRATLAWSWDLLAPRLQHALADVALLDAPFGPELADEVLDDPDRDDDDHWPLDWLHELVDASLVQRVAGPTAAFVVPVSVRAFVREQAGDRAAARHRLARHLDGHLATFDGPSAATATALLPVLDHLLTAADDPSDAGWRCARYAVCVLRDHGPWRRGRALAAQCIARAPSGQPVADLWLDIAVMARRSGDWDDAERAADQAAVDPALRGHAEQLRGLVRYERGQPASAVEAMHDAVAAARQGNDPSLLATCLSNLGWMVMRGGAPDRARTAYGEALVLYREARDADGEAAVLDKLATLAFLLGDLDAARRDGEQALALHRGSGNRFMEAICLGNLGTVAHDQGRPQDARAALDAAVALHQEVGNRLGAGIALVYRAELDDDPEASRRDLSAAADRAAEVGAPMLAARVALARGRRARTNGALDEADAELTSAEAHARAARDRVTLALVLTERATLHDDAGALAEAEELVAQIGAAPGSRLGRAVAQATEAVTRS